MKASHLIVVGAIAVVSVVALRGFVLAGHGAAKETKTIASMPATISDEAAAAMAIANVRSAVPSIEAFYADHSTYAGATISALRAYDPGIDPTVRLGWVNGASYCLESTVDGQTASSTGPGGQPVAQACR